MNCESQIKPKVPLYCSAQIQIPDKFPDILKSFAKAAIKTQPKDILKWSAAYFRSLADDLPPLMKSCLEKEYKHKYITKGFIRMLIEKIGKGFFVHRKVLEKHWELVLPMDELSRLLSLARMFHWDELHWLKIIGLMAGCVSKNLRETMILLCDLLTEDLESEVSAIPIWMFVSLYRFLAGIDCSEEQKFTDGRRVLENGELEECEEQTELPYIICLTSINNHLKEVCSIEDIETDESCSIAQPASFSYHSDICQDLSPKFDFQKCEDFNGLMFFIKTHEVPKQPSAPYEIKPKKVQIAKDNEEKVKNLRQIHDIRRKEGVILYKAFYEKKNLFKALGPPWSWLYELTSFNDQNLSYNFIDQDSISSNCSIKSSIESNKSVSCTQEEVSFKLTKEDDEELSSNSSYQSTFDKKNISELLINNSRLNISKDETQAPMDPIYIMDDFETMIRNFKENLSSCSSDDESKNGKRHTNKSLLRKIGEQLDNRIEYDFILEILKNSKNKEFQCFEEILDYIRNEYETWMLRVEHEEGECSKTSSEVDMDWVEKISIDSIEIETNVKDFGSPPDYQGSKEAKMICRERSVSPEEGEIEEDTVEPPPPDNIEDILKNNFKIDSKVKNQKIDEDQILGLISEDPESTPRTVSMRESSSLSEPSTCIKKEGYYSDDSSIFSPPTDVEKDDKIKFKNFKEPYALEQEPKEPFSCIIPKLRGIGGKVPDDVMAKFIKFIKCRAMQQDGMVKKSNLLEDVCPPLEDLNFDFDDDYVEMRQPDGGCNIRYEYSF